MICPFDRCSDWDSEKSFAQRCIANNEQNLSLGPTFLLPDASFSQFHSAPGSFTQGLRAWILKPNFLCVNPSSTYSISASVSSSETETNPVLISLVKKIKELKYVNINKLKRAWQTVSPTSLCHCNYYYHLYYFYFLCPISHELETALPSRVTYSSPFPGLQKYSFLLRELRNVS